MKKILLIIPTSYGTIPKVSFNIYKALSKFRGIKVFVANLSYTGDSGYPSEIEFKCTDKSNMGRLLFLFKLKKTLNVDIAISTSINCNTFNVLSKSTEKTIGIFHAPLEQIRSKGLVTFLMTLFSYTFLYKSLDAIYAVSETVKKDLIHYIRNKKVSVVYNIHDFEHINTLAQDTLPNEELNIFMKKTFLCVGDLLKSKGVSRLLQAFAFYIKKYGTNVNLVFIGSNKQPQHSFEKEARELGIHDNTYFLGYKSNPYKYMKRCFALIQPSFSEGLPGVLIEALSLNKKVVSTNSSFGVWEIMQCINDYKENLDDVYKSPLGYITPNLLSNEHLNIQVLCETMNQILSVEAERDEIPFNKERFMGDRIVERYFIE